MLRTTDANRLLISGNFLKWLQGHNLFGTDDLLALVATGLHRVARLLDLNPTETDISAWAIGDYELRRVDCTGMWRLRTREDVRAYLRALERQARSRHGGPLARGGTVYFGKHSRRWALKAYSKGDELDAESKGHALPAYIPRRQELYDYADTALRFELVLRSMELKTRGLARASAWASIDPLMLLQHAIGTLDMTEKFSLTPVELDELAPRLVLVYEAWCSGKDLRQLLAPRTYYRYRKELLTRGIDISILRPARAPSIVPLVRALRPESLIAVPHWARGTAVLAEPQRRPDVAA
jgi:II/X family phage/plasmid replication protein